MTPEESEDVFLANLALGTDAATSYASALPDRPQAASNNPVIAIIALAGFTAFLIWLLW
jgi:hypothetical protein